MHYPPDALSSRSNRASLGILLDSQSLGAAHSPLAQRALSLLLQLDKGARLGRAAAPLAASKPVHDEVPLNLENEGGVGWLPQGGLQSQLQQTMESEYKLLAHLWTSIGHT